MVLGLLESEARMKNVSNFENLQKMQQKIKSEIENRINSIKISYNLKRKHSGIDYYIPEEFDIKLLDEGNRICVCEEKITKPFPNEWVQNATIVSKKLSSQNVS